MKTSPMINSSLAQQGLIRTVVRCRRWKEMVMKAKHVALLLLALSPGFCAAQDFSADVFYLPADTRNAASDVASTSAHSPSKLYVSSGKIRLDTRGPDGAVLIVNEEKEGTFALFPAKKQYERLDGGPSEYFRVVDTENACPDWERAAAQKISCERVGDEIVNGRNTVKYRNTRGSDVPVSSVWIDVATKFVVKWEGVGTAVELRGIVEGKQASDLFLLPPDYDIPKPRKGANKGFAKLGQ
jgi:hypothetical protein